MTKYYLKKLSQSALAENTRIAYEKAWNRFEQYCSDVESLAQTASPELVASFLNQHRYISESCFRQSFVNEHCFTLSCRN